MKTYIYIFIYADLLGAIELVHLQSESILYTVFVW